jgi:tetratricopeptide (TPR) repeat protein/tRNA A-37 threonylcarbamoyl transferase component Bud32
MDEESLFAAALEKHDAAGRQAFLDEACRGDVALRQRLGQLLAAHEKAAGILEYGPGAASPQTEPTVPPLSADRLFAGRFKLRQKLGAGGMGEVWVADQTEPVRRRVALKVVRPGFDSARMIARFDQERQALALMDHPNIARVLDAGIDDTGRPYFVMELIKGVPITDYCDAAKLSPRERLELFGPVCRAVQHAHQKGIIHRDLKPSNILVALYDGKPVPKVIDFGVAKVTGPRLNEQSVYTEVGTLVGTLEYLSPEQAELNNLDVDTRSDIYSLGAVLYELLSGTTPLQRPRDKDTGLLELLRVIREDEPPRPSTRLSTTEGRASIAANRGLEPNKLRGLLRGDLDWIVMKCLEKDRTRRYETADGLARDIDRYLGDEPVEACPPGAWYRLRKFLKRNKGHVVAAALLLAGIAGTTCGMIRAEHARRHALSARHAEAERAAGERRAKEEAQKRLAQVEKGTDILASLFGDLDPQAADNEGVALRALLSRRLGEAALGLEGEVVGDPLVVARLQHVLGVSLRELGHLEQAEGVLVKACQTRERLQGPDHLDTAATKHDLAVLYRAQGKYASAERLYHEVLVVRTANLGDDHPATLTSRHRLAILYFSQGKFALAETLHKEVLAVRTARLGADHDDTLASQHWLALLYRSQGRHAEAERLYQHVVTVRTAKLGDDHLDTVGAKGDLASLYRDQGKYELAEKLFEEELAVRTAKLGAHHPDTLTCRHQLALLNQYQQKFDRAEALSKDVLALRAAKLGADHPHTLTSQHHLAGLYGDQGKFDRAEALYKEVLARRAATLGADHPHTLHSRINLAGLYRSTKRLDLSIPLLEEAAQLMRAKLGPDHMDALAAQRDLGLTYCDAGRFDDAIAPLKEVHQKGRERPELAWVGDVLLTAYVRAGKVAEATTLAAEQVRAARKRFAADSPELATALSAAGQALLDAGAYAEAEPLLRENLNLREKKASSIRDTHQARSQLGAALLGQKKHSYAETLLLQGYAGMKEGGPMITEDGKACLMRTLQELVQLYDAWGRTNDAAKWRKELDALCQRSSRVGH